MSRCQTKVRGYREKIYSAVRAVLKVGEGSLWFSMLASEQDQLLKRRFWRRVCECLGLGDICLLAQELGLAGLSMGVTFCVCIIEAREVHVYKSFEGALRSLAST